MLRALDPLTAKYSCDDFQIDDGNAVALGVELAPSPDGGPPLRHETRKAIVVPWEDLRELALVDPWPRFRLAWTFPDGTASELIGPAQPEEDEAFGQALERTVAHVAARMPERVARGWLDAPIVPWEPVDAMPVDERTLDTVEWLRATPTELRERVRASRTRTSYEALLAWLASRASLPWRAQPRALAVTDDYVYAERADESVHRLPLEALRLAFHNDSDDHVFVFGRSTRLVLPARLQCRVVDELLDRLEEIDGEQEHDDDDASEKAR